MDERVNLIEGLNARYLEFDHIGENVLRIIWSTKHFKEDIIVKDTNENNLNLIQMFYL